VINSALLSARLEDDALRFACEYSAIEIWRLRWQ